MYFRHHSGAVRWLHAVYAGVVAWVGTTMSNEAKTFMLGLDQSKGKGGMIWHGKVPNEIKELFGIDQSDVDRGIALVGVYVKTAVQYESYVPEFMNDKRLNQ